MPAPFGGPMHQVSLYETQTGIVLCEQIVGDQENALRCIEEGLQPHWIKGRLLSGDALYPQRAFCLGVRLALSDYLLFAKGHQPTLSENLRLFFQELPVDCHDWRPASTCEKGQARLERRQIIASTDLNVFRANQWLGVAQVLCLRRLLERPLDCTAQRRSSACPCHSH